MKEKNKKFFLFRLNIVVGGCARGDATGGRGKTQYLETNCRIFTPYITNFLIVCVSLSTAYCICFSSKSNQVLVEETFNSMLMSLKCY